MQTDPLKRWSNRVARCPHAVAIGLPGIYCDLCSPPEQTRKQCTGCRSWKLITAFQEMASGKRRGKCIGCSGKKEKRQ